MKTKILTVRVSQDTWRAIKVQAAQEGVTLNVMLARLIKAYDELKK